MNGQQNEDDILARRLRALASADAADALKGIGVAKAVMHGIRLVGTARGTLAGRARTLRLMPDREDIQTPVNVANRKLYESLEPDDIVVLDAMGVTTHGVVGDMMYARMAAKGAVGVVVDGALRDTGFVGAQSFGLFARASAPASYAGHLRPWENDVPIQCGGVLVMPGDWLVGDADGVVVIPAALVRQVCDKAEQKAVDDAFSQALLRAGFPLDDAYPLPAHMRPFLHTFSADGILPDMAAVAAARGR